MKDPHSKDNVSTPVPDNITTGVSGLTRTITYPTGSEREYGEPHRPTPGRVEKEKVND